MNNPSNPVKLYDSLKKSITQIADQKINIYLCGHTAYDAPHPGNMRSVVVMDMFVRVMRKIGREVYYVRNTTDIDDKIIEKAQEKDTECRIITDAVTKIFKEAEAVLGCAPPTLNPYATAFIPSMLQLIEDLIQRDIAYERDGDVFFSVERAKIKDFYPTEFKTSGYSKSKKDQRDFTLWKAAKSGEPSWPSPYGLGRPGWHTECVAMIMDTAKDLTIHAGGCDLMFPHHANELLQLREYGYIPKVWMHVGMLVDGNGAKMSKSLGNSIDVVTIMDHIPPVILRIALLSTYYRHPLPWTRDKLQQAEAVWSKVFNRIKRAKYDLTRSTEPPKRVMDALCEDFNVPKVLSMLDEMTDDELFNTVEFLGLFDASQVPQKSTEEEVQKYVDEFKKHHKGKEYDKSDKIRNQLLKEGVYVLADYSWYCGLPEGFEKVAFGEK